MCQRTAGKKWPPHWLSVRNWCKSWECEPVVEVMGMCARETKTGLAKESHELKLREEKLKNYFKKGCLRHNGQCNGWDAFQKKNSKKLLEECKGLPTVNVSLACLRRLQLAVCTKTHSQPLVMSQCGLSQVSDSTLSSARCLFPPLRPPWSFSSPF